MQHRRAALTAIVLALPLPALLTIAVFEIEPFHGLLKAQDGIRQSVASLIALIAAFLLLPVAAWISLAPVVRAGNALTLGRVNLMTSIAILSLFLILTGTFVIDQLPCWLGRPNCD